MIFFAPPFTSPRLLCLGAPNSLASSLGSFAFFSSPKTDIFMLELPCCSIFIKSSGSNSNSTCIFFIGICQFPVVVCLTRPNRGPVACCPSLLGRCRHAQHSICLQQWAYKSPNPVCSCQLRLHRVLFRIQSSWSY